MYIDYDDINQPISRNLVFSFYGCMELHEEISKILLDFRDTDYAGRVKINSLSKLDDLPTKKENYSEKGKLNMEWVHKTTNIRPSVLTLVYDAKNKSSNVSWTEFENNICTDIYKVRKSNCYPYMSIQVFILSPNPNFSLDSVADEKDKPYSVKKQIDTKIIYFTSIDVIRLNAKKLQSNYFKSSILYYKQVKKNLKTKKSSLFADDYDAHVKISLKLGIVSLIKNKRLSFKYFEDALTNLMRLGQGILSKAGYLEVKAIATYIFKRLIKMKSNSDYLKQNFSNYVIAFHKRDFYKNEIWTGKDGRSVEVEDITYIAENLWLATEQESFSEAIKSIMDSYPTAYHNVPSFGLGFPGYYSLQAAYAYSRILNALAKRNYTAYEPRFDLRKLNVRKSIYLGKQPVFVLFTDPLNPKEIPFDEELHMRNFAEKYNLNQNDIFSRLCKALANAQSIYQDVLQKQSKGDKGTINYCSNLAFHTRIIKFISENNMPKQRLSGIYRQCLLCKDLDNFPLLKLKLLEDFNTVVDDPDTILSNLIQIADFRKLTLTEEETFHNLLLNENIHQKFNLGKNYEINNLLNFNIDLVNNNPLPHDISEFNISVKSFLQKIKINKIKMFFSNPERNITKDLGKNFYLGISDNSEVLKELLFSHKLFVRESDKNLRLTSLTVDLACREGSTVVIDVVLLQKDGSKVLQVKPATSKALKFEFNNKLEGHVHQNLVYSLKCLRLNPHVNIDSVNMKLYIKSEDEVLSSRNSKQNETPRLNNTKNEVKEKDKDKDRVVNSAAKSDIFSKKPKNFQTFKDQGGLMSSAILASKNNNILNKTKTFANNTNLNANDNFNESASLIQTSNQRRGNSLDFSNQPLMHDFTQKVANARSDLISNNNNNNLINEESKDATDSINQIQNEESKALFPSRRRSVSQTQVNSQQNEEKLLETKINPNNNNEEENNNNEEDDLLKSCYNDGLGESEFKKADEVNIETTEENTDLNVKEIEISQTGLANIDGDVLKSFLEDKDAINNINQLTTSINFNADNNNFNEHTNQEENYNDSNNLFNKNPSYNCSNLDIDALIENMNKSTISLKDKKDKVVKINSYHHLVETNMKDNVSTYQLPEDTSNYNNSNSIFESVMESSNANLTTNNTNITTNTKGINVPNLNLLANISSSNSKQNNYNTNNSNANTEREGSFTKENLYYFYWINEDGLFMENDIINYNIKKLQDNEEFKCFIKFTKCGVYKLVIKIQYRLTRDNLDSDSITVCFKDEVELTITDLFTLKQECPLQAYLSQDKKKYYPFNTDINVNLELTNRSRTKVTLHKVLFENYNKSITISSQIDRLLKYGPIELYLGDVVLIPFQILYLNDNIDFSGLNHKKKSISSSNYSVSFSPSNEESHSPGWLKILWRESNMNKYIEDNIGKICDLNELYNELVIPLVSLDFKSPDIKMGITVEPRVFYNQRNEMNLIVENLTKNVKRIHFLIDNGHHILIHGSTKKKFMLPPLVREEIKLSFIPLSLGNFSIPVFKIVDCVIGLDDNKNLTDKKICSIYYYPKSILSVRSSGDSLLNHNDEPIKEE